MTAEILNWAAIGLAVVLLAPAFWVFVECLAAVFPKRRRRPEVTANRPSVAVVIPAHDEAATIKPTLDAALRDAGPNDRVVVVADNCTDETAKVAAETGAEVVVRRDPERRGKGFALDCGLRHLAADPPGVVVIVDADCDIAPGTFDGLAREVQRYGGPVQATNVLYPPPQAGMRDYLSALAFATKGAARSTGLTRLGLPCLLGGTGMAVPWEQMRSVSLASGNIVEDMQLGLDLALAGHYARCSPAGRVTGTLPGGREAATGQRTRWEHGHLSTILRWVPRLVWAAIRDRRVRLLALAMELAVAPLAFYAVIIGVSLGGFTVAAACGFSDVPLRIVLLATALLLAAVVLAWWGFARDFVPGRALLSIPFYAFGKIPIYARFLVRRQTDWVRTERAGHNEV